MSDRIGVVIEKVETKAIGDRSKVTYTFERGTPYELADGIITLISADVLSVIRETEFRAQPIISIVMEKEVSNSLMIETAKKYCIYRPF